MNRVFIFIMAVGYVAVTASAEEPANAPEANRASLAKLLQKELAQEVQDKVYRDSASDKVKLGFTEVEAKVEVEGQFTDAADKLEVSIPRLQNFGPKGLRLTANVSSPLQVKGKGSAGPLSLDVTIKGVAQIEVEADIKLQPLQNGKVKAEIEIQSWQGRVNDIDLGDGTANKILGPVFEAAANKLIDDKANELKKAANDALKQAAEEGRTEFVF